MRRPTKKTATSEIKVHCLSHKRATQRDPSLAKMTFHKIFVMYWEIKVEEQNNMETILADEQSLK